MPLGTEVGLGPSDIVLDGTQLHPPKGAQQPSPIFSTHVYCGQTDAWIRMPRGMQIGLSPSDIVLDGDPCHTNPNPTH